MGEVLLRRGGVEQTVELRDGGVKATCQFAPTEPGDFYTFESLDGEFVGEQIREVFWILVVFECVVKMYGSFSAGFEAIGERFGAKLFVDKSTDNLVGGRRRR